MQSETNYRPWLPDSRRGHRLLALGLLLLLGAWQAFVSSKADLGLVLLLAGGVSLYMAGTFYRRAVWRRHGQAFEASALKQATVPAGWRLDVDIPHAQLGNIDALITRPDGMRFSVELKSWECLRQDAHGRLIKCNGHHLRKDPVRQCRQQGRALRAKPVLWLPKGRGHAFHHQGVLVIQGDFNVLIGLIAQAA